MASHEPILRGLLLMLHSCDFRIVFKVIESASCILLPTNSTAVPNYPSPNLPRKRNSSELESDN